MDDVEELMRAAERRAEALAAGDPEALRAVLHPKFRWISHRGEMFDRESYIRTNTVGSLVWKRQQLGDLSVVVIGDVGIVTVVVTDEVEIAGAAQTFTMPVTQTWVRQHRNWLCLAGHAGPLRSEP